MEEVQSLAMILDNNLEIKELDSQLTTCSNCGEPIQKRIELLGKIRIVPRMCSCKQKAEEQKKKEEEITARQDRIKQLFTNSLMDKKFKMETFENWDFSKGRKNMYDIGIKYCDRFQKIKKEGLGFLLYGSPGNGKTYFSNCIGNRLINDLIPVICVGINQILDRIRQTYSKYGQEGEDTVLRGLALADLLILDDLGTENLTDWSRSKVYNIIDARYRNKLPIIVSTNKSIEELREMYHDRTIDRLLEMCTPIENRDVSIRQNNAKNNTDRLRDMLS